MDLKNGDRFIKIFPMHQPFSLNVSSMKVTYVYLFVKVSQILIFQIFPPVKFILLSICMI